LNVEPPARLDVLYITHNGIADHIGQSQIAPYCLRLAEIGYSIHVLSAEKPGRAALKERYRKLFADRGIEWTYVTYHNRPPLVSQFYDVAQMWRAALAIARRARPVMVHCRSYLPITIGVDLKRKFGTKLLIDFRHFWVEAGLADSRYKFVYRAFKRWEPSFFAAADHVVALTEKAAGILNGWYPSKAGLDRFTVIPCCADFAHFDLVTVDPVDTARTRRELALEPDDFVLLYLGSIGPDYLLAEMMALFKQLLALRPSAKFLFVSNNGEERVEDERQTAGLPMTSIRFVNVPRDEIPRYLAVTDLSVLFYRPDLSRAGCSPTKLAELLACNIPVVANTNVGDLDQILSIERNASVVVKDFAPATLRTALEQVLAVTSAKRHEIRAASTDYSLEAGARRYAGVYEKLVGPPSHAVGPNAANVPETAIA